MWSKLKRWVTKKHPKTGRRKTMDKYFRNGWRFKTSKGYTLLKYSDIHIKRHIKVQGCRSPFDGDFVYWASRLGKYPVLSTWKAKLLKKQKGRCVWCKLFFKHGDIMEIDHITPKLLGGKIKYDNIQILHGHCHDIKTSKLVEDIQRYL